MKKRVNVLATGLALLCTSAAGCSSTTASSLGAAQDDVVGSSSPPASSPASPPPASAEPAPASSPTDLPLLGSSDTWVACDSGLAYACGNPGPGGGVVFFASSKSFAETGSACGSSCRSLPGRRIWRYCSFRERSEPRYFRCRIPPALSGAPTRLVSSPNNPMSGVSS